MFPKLYILSFLMLSLSFSAFAEEAVTGRFVSPEHLALLQELDKTRVALDREQQALSVREKLVEISEKKLQEKIDHLDKLQKKVQQLLENLSDKEEEELMALTNIYEKMKPAAAATVIDQMDNRIVFDIFKRMKKNNTAKIMEKMNPQKTRIISEMLAEKSQLPEF